MRRVAVILIVLVNAAGAFLLWNGRTVEPQPQPQSRPTADAGWSALDAQGRCEDAAPLVTYRDHWPTVCRWRHPGELLQGQSFPPPVGPPPFDHPRVEIYVAETQTREEVANAIAHEYGHMHHTREPDFVEEWLEARALPATTPSEVWTEDYAEVFAALFSPPSDAWQASTPRPTPEALATLKRRFFS